MPYLLNGHRVKIGICGLHYHPSDPYSPFEIFNFFYTSLFPFFAIYLWITYRVGTAHMSSTKIHKLLNTHDSQLYNTQSFMKSTFENFKLNTTCKAIFS